MAAARTIQSILVALSVTMLCACQPDAGGESGTVEAIPATAAPLDLSRDHLQSADPGTVELAEDPALLPDLFSEEGEDRRVSISGNVITNDAATTLRDSVDGAEVKIEVKTP